jgi:hypothetical protein
MAAITPKDMLNDVERDYRRPQRIFENFCKKNDIYYVELLDRFINLTKKNNTLLRHSLDGHLNARGNFEIANLLANPVREFTKF